MKEDREFSCRQDHERLRPQKEKKMNEKNTNHVVHIRRPWNSAQCIMFFQQNYFFLLTKSSYVLAGCSLSPHALITQKAHEGLPPFRFYSWKTANWLDKQTN